MTALMTSGLLAPTGSSMKFGIRSASLFGCEGFGACECDADCVSAPVYGRDLVCEQKLHHVYNQTG